MYQSDEKTYQLFREPVYLVTYFINPPLKYMLSTGRSLKLSMEECEGLTFVK